jgi:5'(3')-deoxyribonucleotidase
MKRKTIILDVDGVVADFVGGLGIKNQDDYEIAWTPAHKTLLRSPHFWESLDPIPGAVDVVYRLMDSGYGIVFCSAPWDGCREWHAARGVWLRKHFGDRFEFIAARKQGKHLVRGDVFIDDHVGTVRHWQAKNPFGRGLIYSQPWNKHEPGKRFTWADYSPTFFELGDVEVCEHG